jgi:hypothetical protein
VGEQIARETRDAMILYREGGHQGAGNFYFKENTNNKY